MSLTDVAIRRAKPADKPIRMFDGGGLYLEISPSGGKLWRLKYRFDGKEKRLAIGTYPEISLLEARNHREAARKLLANDSDPADVKKAQKAARLDRAANSFEVVAREWFAKYEPTWVDSHGDRIIRRFERDLFPWIGGRAIAEVKAPELLACLRRIEERGALETAHRALQNSGQVFRYAVATGRTERDITSDLRGALPPVKPSHRAALTEPKEIGELLRAIEGYSGSLITKCAMQLAPLVFLRPGELRNAEWVEIDLDKCEWNIPAAKMKMRQPHLIPLASQAVTILREIQALTGQGRYVFPSARTSERPMSNNAVLAALRRMGYEKEEMSGHGFRAMARTILDEVLGVRPDYIEHHCCPR